MIKYMIYFDKITKILVKGETQKQIILTTGRRENKISDWKCYFDTWGDAHNYLIEKAEREVSDIWLSLERAKGKLGQIKGMKNECD